VRQKAMLCITRLIKRENWWQNAPAYDVPLHIRNAPTSLMKDLGYGVDYRYAHDYPRCFVAGDSYFPPELHGMLFFTNRHHAGLNRKLVRNWRILRN
jgi:putative ATPase